MVGRRSRGFSRGGPNGRGGDFGFRQGERGALHIEGEVDLLMALQGCNSGRHRLVELMITVTGSTLQPCRRAILRKLVFAKRMACRACRSFLAFILKFLNFLQTFVGIAIILYSVWMLNHWNHNHNVPPPSAPSPESDPAGMLALYTSEVQKDVLKGFQLPVVILLEAALVGFILLDKHWQEVLVSTISCSCLYIGIALPISFIDCISSFHALSLNSPLISQPVPTKNDTNNSIPQPESTCAAESSPEVGQPVPASQDCEKPDAAVGAGVSPDPRNLREEQAAIKAQAAFRGYLVGASPYLVQRRALMIYGVLIQFVSKAIGADLIVHAKHWREVCRTAHDSGLTSKAKDITIAASCLCPAPVSLCVYTGTSCRELQLP